MYLLILLIFLAAGLSLAVHGILKTRKWEIFLGVALLAGTVLFFWFMGFWGERLWFDALGYDSRFWTVFLARLTASLLGALLAGLVLLGPLLASRRRQQRVIIGVASLIALLFGIFWGQESWDLLLPFWNQVPGDVADPVLGHSVGFYLFVLPFLDSVLALLLTVVFIGLVGTGISLVLAGSERVDTIDAFLGKLAGDREALRPLGWIVGAGLAVLGANTFIGAYHLMYSVNGVVTGPGWTDVHIGIPAHFIVGVMLVLSGLVFVLASSIQGLREKPPGLLKYILGVPVGLSAALYLAGLVLLPALVQWLYVKPNEVSVEKPYIANNIEFTRQGFRLDEMEERQFPVVEDFNRELAAEHKEALDQVRLWDPRALDSVYKQFQEIRLYYEFIDVDIDRYTIDGDYRQVMVSPRELALRNLPDRSKTFVNERFKYTHGYGLTMAPVNEFTSGGLPRLLVKDLPPVAEFPGGEVREAAIYYGELSDNYAVVNTEEREFDYPKGEDNQYVRYSGTGGVQLKNGWRKFLYGWKFGGTKLLLSSYPNTESRIQFHRSIQNRIRKLAPFLKIDHDPYIVLHDGRLYWIADAYTASPYYPYSEPFSSDTRTSRQGNWARPGGSSGDMGYLEGANYVRNSVKVVVNAFNGSVDFYIFDPADPIIQVWQKAFPGLFQPRESMPEGLQAHVRYPEGFLLSQGLVYARYHMTDPEVFYNQEDIWVRATEKYYAQLQPVEPYYVMWEPPGTDSREFILMLPFTPKHRQVLIGWIAGMCDGENYGRLLAYKFSKDKHVLGTQQVETKIDQDPYLSQQLSLWDQRGSRVVRGNVLAIPVDQTLLYVEPIYLQAEAAAYPELRLVIVMQGDQLSYAESFDEALAGLYSEQQAPQPGLSGQPVKGSTGELIDQASKAFGKYLDALSERNFSEAGSQLESLSKALEQLKKSRDADESI